MSKYTIHETAIVVTDKIGTGTRIWAFVNIQKNVTIGADCNICDHCFIEQNVTIGDRVTIKNGVSVWDGVTIADDVFIGPNTVFTNDINPRSKIVKPLVATIVSMGASIGANAVIVAGNKIGSYSMVGAGAVVTHDIRDYALVYGNPSRLAGYVCSCGTKLCGTENTKTEMICDECSKRYRFANNILTPINRE